jgi:protocatechuate 3,4-dioxygenase beta subunit
VVTDASGAPVAGAGVEFGIHTTSDVSTVTLADGSYTLHVFLGASGALTVGATTGLGATTELDNITGDTETDFALPALAQVQLTVEDANSNPLAGIVVDQKTHAGYATFAAPFGDTLPNGDAVAFSYAPGGGQECTTDASGQCLFSEPLGATPIFSATTQLVPSDPSYPTFNATAGATPLVTDALTDATMTFASAPDNLATLSGVVTDASGAPVAGTGVSFGVHTASAVSTVTDANGSYTLHVILGASGVLTTGFATAPPPLAGLGVTLSRDLPAITGDTESDITFPALPAVAQVRLTVDDANSNPLAGVIVDQNQGKNAFRFGGTLPNGDAVTFSYALTDDEMECTTDASGQCLFPAPIGATPGFTATTQLVPSDPSYPTFTATANTTTVVTDALTDATITFASASDSLATLSGVVTDPSGAPVAGASVDFGGRHSPSNVYTVTDANGSYTLHVILGASGPLTVGFGATPPPLASLSVTLSRDLPAIIGDTESDITLPTLPAVAQVRLTVEDANSNPLAGVIVDQSETKNSTQFGGTLPNGDAVTFSYAPPDDELECTTDASGQCLFSAPLGATLGFSATTQLVPGDSSYPTLTAGTSQLVTDSLTDATIPFLDLASFSSTGSVTGSVAVGSPEGTSISGLSNQSVPGNALPSGAQVLTGALSYQVSGLAPGGSADVTFVLPPGSNPTSVYKLQGGVYVDFSSIATITGDTVTLHLTDGGLGDSDGLVNGVIVDPLILSRAAVPGAPTIGPVTAGNASASVSFAAPAEDGDSPILDYTAACSSSNGGVLGSTTGSGSPLLVAGLANGSAYTCAVTARNEVGSSSPSTASSSFSPAVPAAPRISKFAPPKGLVGTSVTISGSHFTGVTAVKFHGTNAQSFTVNSSTEIAAVVASGSTSGTISVTGPGGTATSSQSFEVTLPPKPQIAKFSPEKGLVGTSVTISGADFTGVTAIKFHGVEAQSFTINSDTKITAVVALGTASGAISITGPGGTTTSSEPFVVTLPPKPQIVKFSPEKGPVGTSVTISGVAFTGVTAVKFHGVEAQSFTINSDTKITAVVALGTASGAISITGPAGTTTSPDLFVVTRK